MGFSNFIQPKKENIFALVMRPQHGFLRAGRTAIISEEQGNTGRILNGNWEHTSKHLVTKHFFLKKVSYLRGAREQVTPWRASIIGSALYSEVTFSDLDWLSPFTRVNGKCNKVRQITIFCMPN